jgi:hypothetical protein
MSCDPAQCAQPVADLAIDGRLPFVPEHWTQLYYTPIYRSLHFEHRLRYNQLFGLRINEYVMMLEEELADRLFLPVKLRPGVRRDAAFSQSIDHLRREEARHFQLFAGLNRAARPDLYPPGQDRLFSRVPPWTRVMFRLAGAMARNWSFTLWYVMAMEEASLSLAREMAERPETETLGPIDPAFAAVHLEHRKDELRHVETEGRLVEQALDGQPAWRRRIDVALFKAMLRGVTTPTRGGSGVKVIRRLVREMPELQDREEEMIRAVLALRADTAFQRSLFNREIMPVTFAVYDGIPELADLGKRMPGYDRG